MKIHISKTFTYGKGDSASDVEFSVSCDGDYTIQARWNVVDGEASSVESITVDGAEHLDFFIEALCRIRAWEDRPKQEVPRVTGDISCRQKR